MRDRRAVGLAALLAGLVTAGVPAPRADAAAPDAATILAKVAAAAGPRPAVWREMIVTTSAGSEAVATVAHRGGDWRERRDRGPFHTERGVSGGRPWHQNANGQTILEDVASPGAQDLPATTVTAVTAPVRGFVLASVDDAGFGTKRYVDAVTWRIVREESVSPAGTVAAAYDDFRSESGFTFAHHRRVVNGIARTVLESRVTRFAANDVTPDEVALAAPRRALVTFPPGVGSTVLPARFAGNIVVRVGIGAKAYDFVLDTGAASIVIDPEVAREIGLRTAQSESAIDAGEHDLARAIVPAMRVGALTMRDVAVNVIPIGSPDAGSAHVVGLLGFDFIAELGLTIDYAHARVVAVPGAQYVPPADPTTVLVPIGLGNGMPEVTATVNGETGDHWTIDVGAAAALFVFDAFARRHPRVVRGASDGPRAVTPFRGAGGSFATQPIGIDRLDIGPLRVEGIVGYRVLSAASFSASGDGLIGREVLRNYTLGLDYGAGRIAFTPAHAMASTTFPK